MPLSTILVLIVLAIVCGGLYVVGKGLWEFEHGFVYFSWAVIILIVGASVYLVVATPTFAKQQTNNHGGVSVQQSNLLLEE